MVRIVDISSVYSSYMDNVNLDEEHSDGSDAFSSTENTAEYEQRICKGKNKNAVMEEGLILERAVAAGGDAGAGSGDENCCCCSARVCLIIWCILFIVCSIASAYLKYASDSVHWYYAIGYGVGGMIVPLITLIGAFARNKCLLITSLIFQILTFISMILATIAVAYFSFKFAKDTKVLKDSQYNDPASKKLQDELRAAEYFVYGMLGACVVALIALIFLMVLTVKAKKNAK